jgi:hypothetical protein
VTTPGSTPETPLVGHPYRAEIDRDAVWDLLAARRAGMLSVGLLTGGYGEDELLSAGAFRVYRGADELLDAIDELGI